MGAMAEAERRSCQRFPLSTNINFLHNPSDREFPGRCSDISEGGMMMYVPVATPVKIGQPISLTVGGLNRPEFANLGEGPVSATIVRVDRHQMLEKGYLVLGLRFS